MPFKRYLDSFGIETITADNGETTLNYFLNEAFTGQTYDVIIVDYDLLNKTKFHIIKEIINKNPNQKIVITTTAEKERILKDLQKSDIEEKDIFLKPSKMSKLVSMLNFNNG